MALEQKKNNNIISNNFLTRLYSEVYNSSSSIGKRMIEDPTMMGFNLYFDFNNKSPLLNISDSGTAIGDSAYDYLININEPARAAALKKFILALKTIVSETPYYFKSIDGLDGLYKIPENGYNHERKLSISTFESVDQRIGSLVNLYAEACYDFEWGRVILPINLRRFNLVVVVSEIRDLRTVILKSSGASPSAGGGTTVGGQAAAAASNLGKNALKSFGIDLGKNSPPTSEFIDDGSKFEVRNLAPFVDTYAFLFNNSEFDFSRSNSFLDSVNNSEIEVADNKFDIKCGRFINKSKIGYFDLDVERTTETGLTYQSEKMAMKISGDGEIAGQLNQGKDVKEELEEKTALGKFSDKMNKPGAGLVAGVTGAAASALGNSLGPVGDKALGAVTPSVSSGFFQSMAPLGADIFDVNNLPSAPFAPGNILYGPDTPDVGGLLSGKQKLGDLNPLAGRNPFEDFSKIAASSVLGSRNLPLAEPVPTKQFFDIINQNLASDPSSTPILDFLDNVVIATLGRIPLGP